MIKQLFGNKICSKILETPIDVEDMLTKAIDFKPKAKVEITFRNSSTLSFLYWTSAKEFTKLLNFTRGNKVVLIVCGKKIISFNKKDILYKVVTDINSEEL